LPHFFAKVVNRSLMQPRDHLKLSKWILHHPVLGKCSSKLNRQEFAIPISQLLTAHVHVRYHLLPDMNRQVLSLK
jgi:hypothetical protein